MYIDNQRNFIWEKQEFSPALSAMHIMSNFDLSDDDKTLLVNVLNLFGLWEHNHPVPGGTERISVLVLSMSGSVNVHLESNTVGQANTMFLIRWERILALSRPDPDVLFALKMAILLEEMCHALYMIRDEYLVKEYVIQIVQQAYPKITLHDLFPVAFDKNNQRILESL